MLQCVSHYDRCQYLAYHENTQCNDTLFAVCRPQIIMISCNLPIYLLSLHVLDMHRAIRDCKYAPPTIATLS